MPPGSSALPDTAAQLSPWYRMGLRFECTQCGNCCTGSPGYVFVTPEEIEKIAEYMGRPGEGLGREYLRRVGRRQSLTEGKDGDCCFLQHRENGKRVCGIYPVRPLQCRTWPFWDINLEDSEAWADAARGCPGMNRGKRYDLVQIELRLNAQRWEDVPS